MIIISTCFKLIACSIQKLWLFYYQQELMGDKGAWNLRKLPGAITIDKFSEDKVRKKSCNCMRRWRIPGADPGFTKGGAKLTQWRRMRRLSSQTRMYGLTLLHKFFVTPPIFPTEEQKKKKKVSIYCYSHYGPSPNLFATTQPSMRLSSTIAVTWRLSKLTEEHDLPVPFSASKTLDRGVINLEGGGGASAPLAPPLPLNPPLQVLYRAPGWNFNSFCYFKQGNISEIYHLLVSHIYRYHTHIHSCMGHDKSFSDRLMITPCYVHFGP